MRGSMHLTLGVAAGMSAAALQIADPAAGVAFAAACTVGSLFPDIDIGSSKISHKMRVTSFFISHIFGHRGFFHSPLCCGLLSYGLYQILVNSDVANAAFIAQGFAVGFLLHLVQDTLTYKGVPWFWPLPFKLHLTKFQSKSPLCWALTLILIAVWVIVLCMIPGSRLGGLFL